MLVTGRRSRQILMKRGSPLIGSNFPTCPRRGVQTTPVKLQGLPQDKRLLFLVAGGDHNIAVFSQSQQPDTTVDLGMVPEESSAQRPEAER